MTKHIFNIEADGYNFECIFIKAKNKTPTLMLRTEGANPISDTGRKLINLDFHEDLTLNRVQRFTRNYIDMFKSTPEWRNSKIRIAQYSLFG